MYKDIYELPVKLYHKIVETGNLEFLFTGRTKWSHAKRIRRVSAIFFWDKIHEQLINEFGVSEDFKNMFYKQQDLNKWEIQALLGDQSAYTFIGACKSDLDRIKGHLNKITDYRKHHADLYRILHQKYGRDPHNLTTFEFYNDLATLQREGEDREMEVIHNGTNG
jgi:hypothetical protein